MSTIFDMLYHEYCRARLAEMRKQLLIPVIGERLQTPSEDSAPAGPRDCDCPTKASPTLG